MYILTLTFFLTQRNPLTINLLYLYFPSFRSGALDLIQLRTQFMFFYPHQVCLHFSPFRMKAYIYKNEQRERDPVNSFHLQGFML